MKFILLFGSQAVGKMTVGQELEKITDLKLLHNHMTIDLLHPLFGYGEETWELSTRFRQDIFESFSRSNQYGLIFTYVWAFDLQTDWDFVNKICEIFESKGAQVYFIELEADLEERLKRNVSSNRLAHKPTKRNTEQSEQDLRRTMTEHRLVSNVGEITKENYLKINNTDYSPEEVANIIKDKFEL